MHYIKKCLEPARILNSMDSMRLKIDAIDHYKAFKAKTASLIELQLTDKCNLKCPKCHFRDKGDVFLDRKWIGIINKEVRPMAISLAGGGEPTLYPNFNSVINELKSAELHPQIGLITNGLYIPEGTWIGKLDWLRVSLYTIFDGQYSGRDSKVREIVLNNIERYMQKDSLNILGVSLLFYKGNAVECVETAFELFKMLTRTQRSIEKFNLQFKRAFVLMDPKKIDLELHLENIKDNLEDSEIARAREYCNSICIKYPDFKVFLNTCSNIENLFSVKKRDQAIKTTDPTISFNRDFEKCYTSLEHRLITPDGFVYPCPTVAEVRNTNFSIGHITDDDLVFQNKILYFYNCHSDFCNKRFCRHDEHNRIVEKYRYGQEIKAYTSEIFNDNFF